MEKNSVSVSDLRPIKFGWLIALFLFAGTIAVSRGAAYLIERMFETGSLEYFAPVAIMVVALAAILIVTVMFAPAYWRRNGRGRKAMVFKFRRSADATGYILPLAMDPYEFAASLYGAIAQDCSFVTYWLGGWFKPPGRFVRVLGGMFFDQECRIRPVGWRTPDPLYQQVMVEDGLGNTVKASTVNLIMLGEAADDTCFNWSDSTTRIRKRLDAFEQTASSKTNRWASCN
jgi:hypothetical protein